MTGGHHVYAVIHELTALKRPPVRHGDMAQTNALRTRGTAHLLVAARTLGAHRFVIQSMGLRVRLRGLGRQAVLRAGGTTTRVRGR